ncbi:MAG: tetratricopeptide repeat protein [Myxococcales bacterium]|nr:tetratricopeptide repeat protein [Myxococcales bacterium]
MKIRWMMAAAFLALSQVGFVPVAAASGARVDGQVVERLVKHGQLSPKEASGLVQRVSERLVANAAYGGSRYDRLRQAVGLSLFAGSGPGDTVAEYHQRLGRVLATLARGLDEAALEAIFTSAYAAQACTADLRVSDADCAALQAAASRTALPPPPAASPLEQAEAALAAGDHRRAARLFGRLAKQQPDLLAAHAGLGRARLGLGDGRRAIASFEQALGLSPQALDLQLGLAEAQLLVRRGAEASASLERIVQDHPDHSAAWQLYEQADPAAAARARGRLHYKKGSYAKALSAYQRAAELQSEHAGTQAAIGACHGALGSPERAEAAYQRATLLAPESAGFHAALGKVRLQQGKQMSARMAYGRALQLDPRHAGARAAMAKLRPAAVAVAPVAAQGKARFAAVAAPPQRFKAPAPGRISGAKLAAAPKPAVAVAAAPQPPVAAAEPPPAAPTAKAEADEELLGRARASLEEVLRAAQAAAEAEAEAEAARAAVNAKKEAAPQDSFMDELMSDPLRNGAEAAEPEPEPAAEAVSAASAEQGAAPELPLVPPRELIGAVLKALQPHLVDCAPDHRGVVNAKLMIEGASGKVSLSDVTGPGLTGGQQCMRALLELIELPRFSQDLLSLGYPYKF